jgi:diaminopimelate decarboxylase
VTIAPQELHNWYHLAYTFGTGKFFFDKQRFEETIHQINNAFSAQVSSFLLSYSVKANYFSGVLQSARALGVNIECASLHEVNLVLQEGVNPQCITLNTPYLTADLVKTCVQQHISINADSLEQLTAIAEEAQRQQKTTEVGVRFNFPEMEPSRFGIPATQENIDAIGALLQKYPQLQLTTLHTHFTGKNKTADVFKRRAQAIVEVYQNYFTETTVKCINIGGGFAGSLPSKLAEQLGYQSPEWTGYAAAISSEFNKLSNKSVTLMIEPGMALVADVFYFVSEVVSIKKVGNKQLALLNTSTIFLKPTGHHTNLLFEVWNQEKNATQKTDYELVGITCREDDVLGTYTGNLRPGSLVVFKNIGAYTLSFRPDFIFVAPEIVTI